MRMNTTLSLEANNTSITSTITKNRKSNSSTGTAPEATSKAPEAARPVQSDAMVDLSFEAMDALDSDPKVEALPNDLMTYKPSEDDIDQSSAAGFADSLYEGILGRGADPEGLDHHVKGLEEGKSDVSSLTSAFVNSEEFKNQNLSEEETVSLLYETLLNREPDQGGLEFHAQNARDKGIDAVIADIVHSEEFAAREADGEIRKRFAPEPTPQTRPSSPASSGPDTRPFDQAALEKGINNALADLEPFSLNTTPAISKTSSKPFDQAALESGINRALNRPFDQQALDSGINSALANFRSRPFDQAALESGINSALANLKPSAPSVPSNVR